MLRLTLLAVSLWLASAPAHAQSRRTHAHLGERALAEYGGVNVHAEVAIDGRDRQRLEHVRIRCTTRYSGAALGEAILRA